MATDHNPAFDICHNNLTFVLHLSHLMQENQQRLQQCRLQAAERAIVATGKVAEAVAQATDWTSLSTLSSTLVRQQTEWAAAFWQDFLGVATANRLALQSGMCKAAEELQAGSKAIFQGYGSSIPQSMIFEDMFKPFEQFANTWTASDKAVELAAAAKRGANTGG